MRFLLFAFLLFLSFQTKVNDETVHVFMIGDSTMANKDEKAAPETGWGQVFQGFFSGQVQVHNYAKNGRSSKNFREEGLWDDVHDNLQSGDYVIIQFGHNDSKRDPERHTDPHTSYKANLVRYVSEARAKEAHPILCTSIVRRKFDEEGNLVETHGAYPDVVREVARQYNVPLIDLQQLTAALVRELGPEESKKLFLYTQPGEYPNRPEGVKDDTHLSPAGAQKVAALAAEAIGKQNIPLKKYLI